MRRRAKQQLPPRADASPDVSKSNSTAIAVSFAAPHGVSDAAADARAQHAPDAPTDVDADAAADARAQQAPNAATDAGAR